MYAQKLFTARRPISSTLKRRPSRLISRCFGYSGGSSTRIGGLFCCARIRIASTWNVKICHIKYCSALPSDARRIASRIAVSSQSGRSSRSRCTCASQIAGRFQRRLHSSCLAGIALQLGNHFQLRANFPRRLNISFRASSTPRAVDVTSTVSWPSALRNWFPQR